MGQYHKLINLDKKQYVHPHEIGNGMKLAEQVGWEYSTATVLVMLLASANGRGGGDFRCEHPLIGAWAGDRIAFIGDYAEPDDVPGINAEEVYPLCNDEKPSSGDPFVGCWTNISPQVREMMSQAFDVEYTGDGWLGIKKEKGTATPA